MNCSLYAFSVPETLVMMGGAALITKSLYTMKRHKKRGAVELAIGVCAALGPFFTHIMNPFLYPRFSITYNCNQSNCTETLVSYGKNNRLYDLRIDKDVGQRIGTIECFGVALNCQSKLTDIFDMHKNNKYISSYTITHIKPT